MLSRTVAMVLAVIFTVLTAAPAVATVECRHQMRACRHCLKAQKDAPPQVKAECCLVKAPQGREPVHPDAQLVPHFELVLALDQSLPAGVGGVGRPVHLGLVAGPAPAIQQRSTPLLQ